MEQRETPTHTNKKYKWNMYQSNRERERGGKWSKIQKHRNRYQDRGDKNKYYASITLTQSLLNVQI